MAQIAAGIRALQRRCADLEAENAGLRTELYRYRGHAVYLCMGRDMDTNAMALISEPDGTVLRATDPPHTEWVLAGGTWQGGEP